MAKRCTSAAPNSRWFTPIAFEDGLLSNHRAIPVVERKEKFIPSGLARRQDRQDAVRRRSVGRRRLHSAVGRADKKQLDLVRQRHVSLCLSAASRRQAAICELVGPRCCRGDRPRTDRQAHGDVDHARVIRPRWPSVPTARRCSSPAPIPPRSASSTPQDGQPLQTTALRPASESALGQHAEQSVSVRRRQASVRRQRGRQQPRRLQRQETRRCAADGLHSRRLVSDLGALQRRRPNASSSPTARVCRRCPIRKGRILTTGRNCVRSTNTSPTLMRGDLSTIDMPTPETMATYTKQAYACSAVAGRQWPRRRLAGGQPDSEQDRRRESDQILSSTSSRKIALTIRFSAT